MLRFLLDEHLNRRSREAIQRLDAGVFVESVLEWQGGRLVGEGDDAVLGAAAEFGLTLVTFDLRTIPVLVSDWARQGRSHGGLVLVDERTIAPNDYGGLARALVELWRREKDVDGTDRLVFLQRSRDL